MIVVAPPPPRYPRTPYWPGSPSLGAESVRVADTSRFVGEPVIVTEKLDGGCTLLHQGAVYARRAAPPGKAPWMAMVKKHHAWKVTGPDAYLYGEDIYGVHSIEYEPIHEDETFYAFALRDGNNRFASFPELADFAGQRQIPVVPVLFDGVFESANALRHFVDEAHAAPSILGGEREGVVIRLSRSFPASEFSRSVCKSVRAGHVRTDQHWTRNWRPCRLARADADARAARQRGPSAAGRRAATGP